LGVGPIRGLRPRRLGRGTDVPLGRRLRARSRLDPV